MKISAKEVNKFISSDFEKYSATLVYGNDYGLISEKTNDIINNSQNENYDESFNFLKLDFNEVNANPAILENEINSICFNQHKKIIHLSHASSTIKPELSKLLEANKNSIIVVSTEELKPSSSLRKTFESSNTLACIACYHDTAVVISELVKTMLNKAEIKYDFNVINYISQRLGNDHQIAVNEIDKICLYFADSKNISINDIASFYTDTNAELSLDNFLENLINGKTNKAIDEIHYLLLQTNHISILRQILAFLQRLKSIKSNMKLGLSAQQAMSQIKPPIFYKSQPIYQKALSKLHEKVVDSLINKAIQLEIRLKTVYISPKIMIDKFVLEIGKLFHSVR
ncbi:MAG: DNA polymerase III subunit delta [Rickettsiales bacterium]